MRLSCLLPAAPGLGRVPRKASLPGVSLRIWTLAGSQFLAQGSCHWGSPGGGGGGVLHGVHECCRSKFSATGLCLTPYPCRDEPLLLPGSENRHRGEAVESPPAPSAQVACKQRAAITVPLDSPHNYLHTHVKFTSRSFNTGASMWTQGHLLH